MSHFFSPVTVDGTPKCADKGLTTHTIGRVWRTSVTYSGDAQDEYTSPSNSSPSSPEMNTDDANDLWLLARSFTNETGQVVVTGSVKFGVSCLQTIDVQFVTDLDDASTVAPSDPGIDYINFEIKVNGTSEWTGSAPSVAGAGQTTDYTIDLTSASRHERPCGNVIELIAELYKDDDINNIWCHVKITDVT